ncbi:hypothetical protein LCGC14_2315910 [marine sediment metagenome]|uniref:DUF4177 domain-containing protein n=1 Tax=marine sediment metagenome TaxID=412755 RepID=A0A0F9EWS4_9ZZZZ
MPRIRKEYKVIVAKESGLGTVLLGASMLPLKKIEAELNNYGKEGWEMTFMVIEQHRHLLFWTREAAVITLSRDMV